MFSIFGRKKTVNIDLNKTPSVVLVGDSSAGKTSYFRRICASRQKYKFNKNYEATEDFNLDELSFKTNVGTITIHMWDTAGQEKFGKLRKAYVHKADMCIVMYDVTERKTKDNIYFWLDYIKKNCKDLPTVVVCGNKKDKMGSTGLLNVARIRECNLRYAYNDSDKITNKLISVKNNENIKETMEWLFTKYYETKVLIY